MRISDWSSDVCSSDLNVMCCPRKSSRMRRRIDAVDRCHELAAGRREQADVGAERDEGRAGRDLVARILGVAGEHAGRLAGAADALDAFYRLGFEIGRAPV